MKKIITESYQVSDELASKLNSILADEFLASELYRIAKYAMKGRKQHLLGEISDENGEDEFEDHFTTLCDWMQTQGIEVVTSPDKMREITNCTIFEIKDGMSTEEIVDILITSEEEAIDVYESIIPATQVDLNVMLCGFLQDEREHLKKLTDAKDEMVSKEDKTEEGDNMVYESTSEMDELQFKLDDEFEDLLELEMMYYDVMNDGGEETLLLTIYESTCIENGENPQAIFDEVCDFVTGLGYEFTKVDRFSIDINPHSSSQGKEKEDPRQMKFDFIND